MQFEQNRIIGGGYYNWYFRYLYSDVRESCRVDIKLLTQLLSVVFWTIFHKVVIIPNSKTLKSYPLFCGGNVINFVWVVSSVGRADDS